jgi:hypothetical protein
MTVGDNLILRLSSLLQDGQFQWVHFYRNGKRIATFTIEISPGGFGLRFYIRALDQVINLIPTYPHFGGKRWWFCCPECQRRCANLSYSNG